MASAAEKQTFYVQREGWALGQYRSVNDEVQATEEEAQYLVMAGNIATEKAQKGTRRAPEPAPDTSLTAETPASKAVAEKKSA